MKAQLRNSFKSALNAVGIIYRQVGLFTRRVVCVGVTLLVWGGALWFGSLAWNQKQGAVLASMGFAGWLAVCRFVLPGFWILSIEVVRRLFKYIEYRFL